MSVSRRATILGLNYAPEPSGIAPYTTALAENLASHDVETTVLSAHPHYPAWERHPEYSGRRRVETAGGVKLVRLWHWIPSSPRGVRRLVSEIAFGLHQAIHRWYRPEAVILVSPALFASAVNMVRLLVTPNRPRIVAWVQDLYYQGMTETGEGGKFSQKVVLAVERWLLRRADTVVAIHPSMADRVVKDLRVARGKVEIVANWTHITPSSLSRADARSYLGWDAETTVVLHCGNMGRKQGLGNVVEAARLAPADVKFVLLGDGAERRNLEALAEGVRQVEFIGPLSDADFPHALAAADILLVNELPGVKDMAVPSKLTSYLAAGRPVLAAVNPEGPVAGIVEAARAGTVVSSGAPEQLLNAAIEIAAEDDSERYGKAAKVYWSENLRADAALERWHRIIFPGGMRSATSSPKELDRTGGDHT